MIPGFRLRLRRVVIQIEKAYVRALYHEHPVHDEATGELIGHEWYTIRGGRVHFDPV